MKDENEESLEACAECNRWFKPHTLIEGVCEECQMQIDCELKEFSELLIEE